jgi:2-keto-4-pentenoate hydratase
VLETAFAEPDRVDPLSRLADLQMHGGLVAGAAAPGWADVDAAREKVTLVVDGAVRYEGAGANPAGADLPALLVWLANHGAARTGGLEAGQWITTGNWTGKNLAGPESEVLVRFRHLGEAVLRFSARP